MNQANEVLADWETDKAIDAISAVFVRTSEEVRPFVLKAVASRITACVRYHDAELEESRRRAAEENAPARPSMGTTAQPFCARPSSLTTKTGTLRPSSWCATAQGCR